MVDTIDFEKFSRFQAIKHEKHKKISVSDDLKVQNELFISPKVFTDDFESLADDKMAESVYSLYCRLKQCELETLNYKGEAASFRRSFKAGTRYEPNESVLTVTVYHSKSLEKSQTFQVLGSQSLYVLRDLIECSFDDMSSIEPDCDSKGSAMFFIKGKIYSDLRHPLSIDYSATIEKWIKEKQSRIIKYGSNIYGNNVKYEMNTTFSLLDLVLYEPYLYKHLGCEHIIRFTSVRKMHSTDCAYKFPLLIGQWPSKRWKCRICRVYSATRVTIGDKYATESPAFYCDECFFEMHYTENGNLLYDDFEILKC